jgi:hypothetical protein
VDLKAALSAAFIEEDKIHGRTSLKVRLIQ